MHRSRYVFALALIVAVVGCPLTVKTPPTENACPGLSTETAEGRVQRKFRLERGDKIAELVSEGPEAPGGRARQTFLYGGEVLLVIEATAERDVTTSTIRYGAAFRGARELVVRASEGQKVQASIDGVALVPFDAGTPVNELRLESGVPMPEVDTSPEVRGVIGELIEGADRAAKSCAEGGRERDEHVGKASQGLEAARGGERVGRASQALTSERAHRSSPEDSAGCIACRATAIAGGFACGWGAAAGCAAGCAATGPFYGICLGVCIGIGAAICVATQAGAILLCWNTVCCPVSCGESACCSGGETCVGSACCSPGLTACNGVSCCAPGDECLRDGTCCPSARERCKDICCPFGESCTPAGCCAKPCGSSCCTFAEKCVDASRGVCCSASVKVCGSQCCEGPQDTCVGGKCCAQDRSCGSVCCPDGQKCVDAAAGRCEVCPGGQEACTPTNVCSGEVYGPPMCCPPGAACCAGGCCPIGQECANGKCGTRSTCVR